jgi:hypothetical protein
MTNYVKRGVLIILLSGVAVGALQSCKKNSEKAEEEEIDSETIKIEKLEKYISNMWDVPVNKIKYDDVKKTFVFKEFEIKRQEIDTLYSRANEYHLKIKK